MTNALQQIDGIVQSLRLDDSLLFLNHVLSVSRRFSHDAALEAQIVAQKIRPPAFVIHFIAKRLLLYASNLGLRTLKWPSFVRLMDLFFEIDDPIQHDPNWKHGDPTGALERLLSQQMPPQTLRPLQRYGLALGLFRDVGPIRWPEQFDLHHDLEVELGVSVEQFMALGHVCMAQRQASHNGKTMMGTFTPMRLAEAYRQGINVCVPEAWTPFLGRVSLNRDGFRKATDNDLYKTTDPAYSQYEFNALCRFPITEVSAGRFVAVDPNLITERTTFGLFYDLFERHGVSFATRFGYVFDRFVGQLLASAVPTSSLWSASDWEQSRNVKHNHGKIGDWAYRGATHTVLFECKSLRPSIELTTYGSNQSVKKVTDRIVSALCQLIGHARSIQNNEWTSEGLRPGSMVCVVVTYGRINTINSCFVRKRILQQLADKQITPLPFVVLSLEELDTTIRLVELGHPLDDVAFAFANDDNSFNVTRRYDDALKDCAVSSFAIEKGNAFMANVVA